MTTLGIMSKTAIAALVLIGSGLGGTVAADAAASHTYPPSCKVLSVVTQTNDDINSANPNHVVTDVKYWTRTITTLKCKGQVTKIVGLWYPVR